MLDQVVKCSKPIPSTFKMVVLGGGFSGQHVAKVVRMLGGTALCSRRQASSIDSDFVFNSEKNEVPESKIFEGTTHILSCIPPSSNGRDPVIDNLAEGLKQKSLEWVGYLSTTGVYGDSKGKWVSETNTPLPQQPRSQRRLACEKQWLTSGFPVQLLRLPGIYGPGRSALDSLLKGKNKLIDKPGQVFSRIHVDDIAGAIMHLIYLAKQGIAPRTVNISDNLPTSNIEVLRFSASLLKMSLPEVEPFEIACKSMSPMALSFWQENRRISNQLLCKELGYSLIHPDYQSGIKECLNQKQKTF